MISEIRGQIVRRTEHGLLVDVHGLCYEVLVPAAILQMLDGQIGPDGTVRLVTFHYHHLEPSRATPVLIGFTNEIEREFFESFITVSGVGPRAALRAISQPIPLIARAIDEGDVAFLRRLPGIGPQRAKEIVAKLQGKVGKYGLLQAASATTTITTADAQDVAAEALAILQQLQYRPAEAKAMIQQALERLPMATTAEELLNEVYRQRSSARPVRHSAPPDGMSHGARRGFTLLELSVVVLLVGVLAAVAIPGMLRAVERARGTEAIATLGIIQGGYLAYGARLAPTPIPGTWNPEPTGTDAAWRELGIADPNVEAQRLFDYDVLIPDEGGAQGTFPVTEYRAQALRRGAAGRWLEMRLETGEIQKSADY